MIYYPLSPYAFIAVTALLFVVSATLYLVWIRPKTITSDHLIAFYAASLLNFLLMYLFNVTDR